MAAFEHPGITRRLFIDAADADTSSDYRDPFLWHLFEMLVHARNKGIADRQLLVHLSEFAVGSLYSAPEHWTVYEAPHVYQWAIDERQKFSVVSAARRASGDFADVPRLQALHPFTVSQCSNGNYIPWGFRAFAGDRRIHTDPELKSMLVQAVRLYNQWSPTSRPLRQLKYRLDPIKAKL